jgi:hypothetical protein
MLSFSLVQISFSIFQSDCECHLLTVSFLMDIKIKNPFLKTSCYRWFVQLLRFFLHQERNISVFPPQSRNDKRKKEFSLKREFWHRSPCFNYLFTKESSLHLHPPWFNNCSKGWRFLKCLYFSIRRNIFLTCYLIWWNPSQPSTAALLFWKPHIIGTISINCDYE